MQEKLFCQSGGCSAKLGAGTLRHVLKKLPSVKDENLLVGFAGADDASVYRLTDDLAIVQTLDFFPPMVDDPYTFGQIAAANALSDIYAMGGTVKTALNIVCFPEAQDLNILGRILQGGSAKIREAGGVLSGGHSIADTGIKYGLSVTGIINPQCILKNNSGRVGDVLILTKPLGSGIITTAARVGQDSEQALSQAINTMTALNKYAAEILHKYRVSACTDVTGFGLLGHLLEMLPGDNSAVIELSGVPYIKAAADYADEFLLTGAAQKNRNFVGKQVCFENVSFAMEEILFDPQTSGGLLAAVCPEDAESAIGELQKLQLPCGIIGKITDKQKKKIIVRGE